MAEKPATNLYQVLSGTNNATLIPSSSALESLKLLQWFSSQTDLDDDIRQLYNEETKYLKSAITLINEDPIVASKFGSDLQSAMSLSGLLREVYAEKEAKDMLLKYINTDKVVTSNAQKRLRNSIGSAITKE